MRTHAVCLLDGGMGHLIKQGLSGITGLPFDEQFVMACLAVEKQPDLVLEAHAAYVRAGCSVLTTNSFAATAHTLGSKVQRSADVASIVAHAARLARQAASAAPPGQQVLVAGSLPPLQESYQMRGLPSQDRLQAEYELIAAALRPHVDILLAETLATVGEAHAALNAAAQAAPDKRVWVSFTLEDSTACRLRDKQPLAAAVQELVTQHASLDAVLVNCCAPAAVTAAMPVLKSCVAPGMRIGAYANGFLLTTTQWLAGAQHSLLEEEPGPGEYDAEGLITPAAYLRHAQRWVAAGADIVGGCCGIGPEHMQLLSVAL